MEHHHARTSTAYRVINVRSRVSILVNLHRPTSANAACAFRPVIDWHGVKNRIVPQHEARPAMGVSYHPNGRRIVRKCVVLDKQELGRAESGWRHPRTIAIATSIPTGIVDVDCGLVPILNERVMVYDTDDRIEYRHAVEIVPLGIVPAKRRSVRVRAINTQYAPGGSSFVCSTSVLKFNPGQA